jgi:hypothetical protein
MDFTAEEAASAWRQPDFLAAAQRARQRSLSSKGSGAGSTAGGTRRETSDPGSETGTAPGDEAEAVVEDPALKLRQMGFSPARVEAALRGAPCSFEEVLDRLVGFQDEDEAKSTSPAAAAGAGAAAGGARLPSARLRSESGQREGHELDVVILFSSPHSWVGGQRACPIANERAAALHC